MFNKIERNPIYRHEFLDTRVSQSLEPLMESAFAEEFSRYKNDANPNRKAILDERKKFIAEQYANRMRIAENMGVHPLYEDANIFGHLSPKLTKLFEDATYSQPSNVIGLGEVRNPMEGNRLPGGYWNQGYKPGSGDVPTYVFGLQTHIPMHCIGFDLMPTINVDTPKVVISYIDTVYGGGVFNDNKNLPSYIEVSNKLFNRNFVQTNELVRHTSVIYIVSNNKLVSSKNADVYPVLKLLFIVGSTIKPAVIVQVQETGARTAAPGASGTTSWGNPFSVKEIIDNINSATEENSAQVYIDTLPEDQTAGTVIPRGQLIGIDYASATRTTIAEAASNNNSIGGMSRAQHEKGPKHKLNVIAMDKQLEMVGIELEADTTNIQIKDMAAMGVNVIAHLYTGVQNDLVQNLNQVILEHLYKLGVTHAAEAKQAQNINHSIYINTPSNATYDFTNLKVPFSDILDVDQKATMGTIKGQLTFGGFENQNTAADRLFARILKIVEFGAQQNRIAPYDFMVLSGELAATIKKNSTFIMCPVANTLSQNPELNYSGTIFETISVYKNPGIDFDDPRILLGRRGNDKDPGAKFLAYDLAASRQIVAEGTMAEKIRVWSRFAIADIGFYPELNYYTFVAINDGDWC